MVVADYEKKKEEIKTTATMADKSIPRVRHQQQQRQLNLFFSFRIVFVSGRRTSLLAVTKTLTSDYSTTHTSTLKWSSARIVHIQFSTAQRHTTQMAVE